MTDDTAITDRLRKLEEVTDHDAPEHTIILDELDRMATTEYKLAKPASARDDEIGDEDWTWIA